MLWTSQDFYHRFSFRLCCFQCKILTSTVSKVSKGVSLILAAVIICISVYSVTVIAWPEVAVDRGSHKKHHTSSNFTCTVPVHWWVFNYYNYLLMCIDIKTQHYTTLNTRRTLRQHSWPCIFKKEISLVI